GRIRQRECLLASSDDRLDPAARELRTPAEGERAPWPGEEPRADRRARTGRCDRDRYVTGMGTRRRCGNIRDLRLLDLLAPARQRYPPCDDECPSRPARRLARVH